jgi:hypothetical protein
MEDELPPPQFKGYKSMGHHEFEKHEGIFNPF